MIFLHTYDVQGLTAQDRRRLLINNLAQYLDKQANEVSIHTNDNGKPLTKGCYFSITHCQNTLIQVFNKAAIIGVDLEHKNPNKPLIRLAKRYFHAQEYEFLSGLSPNQLTDAFYRLWTAKEAVCKAKGGRLWYYLSDNYLNKDNPEKTWQFVKNAQYLDIRHFNDIEHYSLTIASESPIDKVCFCDE